MDQSQIIADLFAIQTTLNRITVAGEDNLGRMLGCIKKTNELIDTLQEDSHGRPDDIAQ